MVDRINKSFKPLFKVRRAKDWNREDEDDNNEENLKEKINLKEQIEEDIDFEEKT